LHSCLNNILRIKSNNIITYVNVQLLLIISGSPPPVVFGPSDYHHERLRSPLEIRYAQALLTSLGTGAFSEVFRVRRKTDNMEYALKKVS